MNRCCARLLGSNTESNSEFADACWRPCGKNNAWTPYMVENRSTGGLASPAVSPVSDREQPFRFALTGCSVGLLNLKLPTLGIPPRSRGGGCQSTRYQTGLNPHIQALLHGLSDNRHHCKQFHRAQLVPRERYCGDYVSKGLNRLWSLKL